MRHCLPCLHVPACDNIFVLTNRFFCDKATIYFSFSQSLRHFFCFPLFWFLVWLCEQQPGKQPLQSSKSEQHLFLFTLHNHCEILAHCSFDAELSKDVPHPLWPFSTSLSLMFAGKEEVLLMNFSVCRRSDRKVACE